MYPLTLYGFAIFSFVATSEGAVLFGIFSKKKQEKGSHWRFAMARLIASDHGLSPCALFDDGSNRSVRFGFWPRQACPVLVFQDPNWDYPTETEGIAYHDVYRHYLRFVGLGAYDAKKSSSDLFLDDLELSFRGAQHELFITFLSGKAVHSLMASMMLADYMQLLDKEKNVISEFPLKVPEHVMELVAKSLIQ